MSSGGESAPLSVPARRIPVAGTAGRSVLVAALAGTALVAPAAPASADAAFTAILLPGAPVAEPGADTGLTLNIAKGFTEKVCLYGAEADHGFTVGGGWPAELTGSAPSASFPVTGAPERTALVTATVHYAAVDADTDCGKVPGADHTSASSPALPVVVPPAAEKPPSVPDEPAARPPKPSPSHPEDPSTPPPKDAPAAPPAEDDTPSEDVAAPEREPDSSDRAGDSGRTGGTDRDHRPAPPPHSPVGTDTAADAPDLPTAPADLPSAGGTDLADLPTVRPGDGDDPAGTTEVAAMGDDPATTSATPLVLLAFLALLLLLSTPMGPARRVRTGAGAGYLGRRRRH